ncbi:MAG: hypothetical protein JXB07_05210, partial [Anaerolineae bacterium]|nr:hypothetical protein [Anaerolineae bacterium]
FFVYVSSVQFACILPLPPLFPPEFCVDPVMFNKSKYEPVKPEGHEGMGTNGRIGFSNGEHSWEESFDLIEILNKVLQEHEVTTQHQNGWLVLNEGFYLRPEILAVQPLEAGGVSTTTTISIAHEQYAPQGLFEYQHAAGDDTNTALASGFKNWADLDLPVLLEAITNHLEACTAMDMQFPAPDQRIRRAVLGPVFYMASREIEIEEDHPFCQCCMLTHSFEAFKDLLASEGFFGIRLLALRNEEGDVSADCRVNGLDNEPGKELLIKYGQTWPDRGFEVRKQYVVVYTRPTNDA